MLKKDDESYIRTNTIYEPKAEEIDYESLSLTELLDLVSKEGGGKDDKSNNEWLYKQKLYLPKALQPAFK